MQSRAAKEDPTEGAPLIAGRYALDCEIASGGMATVYLGSLVDPVGFTRTVAIKRLHPQFARDSDFAAMFLDEARLTSRIRHPNVVPTLDVVATDGELLLVMEYVEGEPLSHLLRLVLGQKREIPLRIVSAIMVGVLRGLHAAHTARDEKGVALQLVHRDVSPHNVLVGVDGVPRLLDFGIAKALGRTQVTLDGRVKGKLGYMSPEQLLGREVTRRSDIFAAGVVLWELAAQKRLYTGDTPEEIAVKVLERPRPEILEHRPDVPERFATLFERALARAPQDRFASACEMADELETSVAPATQSETSRWVGEVAEAPLAERALRVARMESRRGTRRAPAATAPQETTPSPSRQGTPLPAPTSASSGAMHRALSLPPPATPPRRRQTSILVLSVLVASLGLFVSQWGRRAGSGGALTTVSPEPSVTIAAARDGIATPSAVPASPALSASAEGVPLPAAPPSGSARPVPVPRRTTSATPKLPRVPDVLEDRE